jgi:hypothetical protein
MGSVLDAILVLAFAGIGVFIVERVILDDPPATPPKDTWKDYSKELEEARKERLAEEAKRREEKKKR